MILETLPVTPKPPSESPFTLSPNTSCVAGDVLLARRSAGPDLGPNPTR